MSTYRRLLTYVKKYKKFIVFSIILSILFSILSGISVYLTIPLMKTLFLDEVQSTADNTGGMFSFMKNFLAWIEGYIFQGGKLSALGKACILIFAAFMLKNLTGFLQSICMQQVEKGVVRDLRIQMYEKINALSMRFFTNERSGNLISIMSNDVTAVQIAISSTFLNLMREPILIMIYLAIALSISWELTIIAFLVFPLTVIVVNKIGSSLRRRSTRMQQKSADIISVISETIYGSKIIRALRGESFKNKEFRQEADQLKDLTMKNVYASELASPITELLTITAGIVIIWFGGRQILIDGTLDPAEFLGFIFVIFQLITPIKNLSSVNNRIQEASASADRIFNILDHEVEVKESTGAVEKKSFDSSILLKDVSFNYSEDAAILKNIDLEIKKSEVIAVVGPSGAGKSTLADLIARFYDPTSGDIFIDNINLKNIQLSSLRNLMGMVQQETILFNDTIRNNIVFGMPGITDEQLVEVCKSANAYDFILQTEKGFDTVIGDRGIKLSGGQKQRLSIARTLLRNPSILILDEATSSLDMESEKLVQNALDTLMTSRTSIVIAHRLSTVKNADRIVVLENGRIAQTGTHEELLSAGDGVYKKLYELQFS
ncbi:MAG TPA: ABC transporter ATP-binding protein [Ignavibacteria bacterium]|nr:ABC transporter ATP-binding protein [Ignavibacteria bacterium]